jgi:tetratricopeptide (TPR) repeat protein
MSTRTRRSLRARSARALSSIFLSAALALCAAPAFADEPAVQEAAKALAASDYDEATQLIDKLDPKTDANAAALLKAELYLRTGKLAAAQKEAERALKSEATKPQAAALRGEALWAQGKTADAIAALKEVEGVPLARRARLLLGEYLIQTGKRADARAPLMTIIDDYNSDAINSKDPDGLSYVGRAAHLLRSHRESKQAYAEAERAGAKKRVETLLWQSDLFLDKYNTRDGGAMVKAAEAIAPNDPRVRVMKARVLLEDAMDFAAAEAEIRRALEVNPGLAEAHFVRAGNALRDLDIEAADKAADAGARGQPQRPDAARDEGSDPLLGGRPCRVREGREACARAEPSVLPPVRRHQRVRGVGAPLRRHHRVQREGDQGRPPEGRKGLRAARAEPDPRGARRGGPQGAHPGVGQGPLQRSGLQHAQPLRKDDRQRLHLGRRADVPRPLPEGGEGDP